MKLKDILNMEDYLKNECYCPGEIYSIDGFFYQIFRANSECKEIGRIDTDNNYLSKIPCIFVISQSTDEINQILLIMHKDNKIADIIRFDATENNIKLIKEVLKDNKTDLKFDEYKENKTKENLEKIFNLADAIMYS
jgi:hypothetical protein